MKRMIVCMLVASLICSCDNVVKYGPNDTDKNGCRENRDTILSVLKGWSVLDSSWISTEYYSFTSRESGRKHLFYRWDLHCRISDGQDTLWLNTEPTTKTQSIYDSSKEWYLWCGELTGCEYPILLRDVDEIKAYNELMKRIFKNRNYFELKDNGTYYRALFEMNGPDIPKPTRSDLGLD